MIATVSTLLVTLASLALPAPGAPQQQARSRAVPPAGRRVPADVSLAGSLGGGLSQPPGALAIQWSARCMEELQDLASGACLTASSTPALGSLYPLGPEFNIDAMGNVGIGTTTPASKLEVAGTAKINGTLTLAPSSDQALNLSTGSLYKNGARFMHTSGYYGTSVGLGYGALSVGGSGYGNVAVGTDALKYNSSSPFDGNENTAIGYRAARTNNSGQDNTAVGSRALSSNTVGGRNTAIGSRALELSGSFYQADHNTAVGFAAADRVGGSRNTSIGCLSMSDNFIGATGNDNIALGYRAGRNISGDDNIVIGNAGVGSDDGTIRIGTAGTHTRAFLAGVRSTTTGVADAIPVMVDSAGQLGTVSSSRRYKQDVHDMGASTDRLLQLRPVVFRYKDHVETMGDSAPVEYGLVAEEVAEIFPELVVRDEEGEPLTVKYHLLSSMLLNELKELNERFEARDRETRRDLGGLRARVAELERRE